MNKIQFKIGLIILVITIFIFVAIVYMHNNNRAKTSVLLERAKQRQTQLLTETTAAFAQTMFQFCYDYTYWDDLVNFVKHPDNNWAKQYIESSASSYNISFVWIFDPDFNQKFGYQTLDNKLFTKPLIGKIDLANAFKKKWFQDFYVKKDNDIFQVYGAPIQPTLDIKRKTKPQGWFLIGRIYKGKLINDISNITASSISIIISDDSTSLRNHLPQTNSAVYTSIPLNDMHQTTIAYLASFHTDKTVEEFMASSKRNFPFMLAVFILFFGSVFLALIYFVARPITILNQSLSSDNEHLLQPLLKKNNEFGALAKMLERSFVQKKNLEQLNSEKDKFFSILAHDLINPFQGLISLTEMMAKDINIFTNAELLQLAEEINLTIKSLFKLLINLLEWAQMQKGTMSFLPQECNLSEIVKQEIDAVNITAVYKGNTITDNITDSISVYGDERMIHSILRNLFSNAVKFTPREGKVIISAKETENKMAEISITDNGIGMSDSLCKKLFKIEEKVSRLGTDGEKSTGLGLLICKEFVEKHGGKIWIESEERDLSKDKTGGSTFYFTLPLLK